MAYSAGAKGRLNPWSKSTEEKQVLGEKRQTAELGCKLRDVAGSATLQGCPPDVAARTAENLNDSSLHLQDHTNTLPT